ncbi:hypothetical protein [Hymenobacter glacialis]|uniref:hypothetical protein n=1 Tax=Hymenobacter glacialis TaxID=1908236 RepID=UPI000F781A7A|nr:hypothetical protein [Hymenobacter glacialis]
MHFHLPRRHRRALLFPPGLLALAGLLWLGCGAVGLWQEQLKPRYVVQLTAPTIKQSNSPELGYYIIPPAEAQKLRPWREAYFSGNPKSDLQTQECITTAIRAIKADTAQDGGVRVRFAREARYEQFVFLLNLMNKEGFKQYWIDFYHFPVTFYALTYAYNPLTDLDACLSGIDVKYVVELPPPPLPFWVQFDNWVTDFWQLEGLRFLQSFWQPEWRASLCVLALITMLSSWRIIRAWRTA